MGDDRPAARGELLEDRDVEVAVGGQGERARDRRGGHVQHVRGDAVRRLAVERAALVDAEAVLLVDHRHGQAVELDGLLDQRVGPDQQLQLAAGELAEQVGAAARRGRAGEQRGLHQLAGHQRLQRGEVLLGERLGRRHQRRLRAGLDRAQHGVDGHHGLAGADLAHEQALHRPVAHELVVDGGHRLALVGGRLERQRVLQPAGGQLAGRLERRRPRALAAAGPPSQERDLEQQQLVIGQPPAAALVVAEVRGVERGRPVRQPVAHAHARRQRLERLLRGAAPLADQSEDLGRRQALGGGVGRHVGVGRADRLARLRVALHAEAVAALVLAVEQQPRPGLVLALKPRLVEERDLHRAGLVGHDRLDQRLHAAPPHGAAGDRPHLDHHRRRLPRAQLDDRARLLAVARQVLEQVADRVEAEPLGRCGRLRRLDVERRLQP